MPLHFFPRDREFWMYHCGALALGLAAAVALAFAWGGSSVGYKISSGLAWMPLYTLAVLLFRWLYKRRGGDAATMGRLIAASVGYSAVAGLLTAMAVIAIVMPFYWPGFAVMYAAYGRVADPVAFFLQNLMESGPQHQLFVAVWSFIYISVTASRRIRKTELYTLRLQNNLKEAQLSSLSNQLNPHFLFNSLNNIRFMIHEDARQAEDMITAFSEILRYSLESSKRERVSLGQELDIIDKYIAIVRAQFEERLHFSTHIAPSLHSAMVPPMVLQMLVENAIKHGLDHLREGGRLEVEAAMQGGALTIEVRNDVAPGPARGTPGTGIGLRNIEQRLQLLYGPHASLHARREGDGFAATLVLPPEHA